MGTRRARQLGVLVRRGTLVTHATSVSASAKLFSSDFLAFVLQASAFNSLSHEATIDVCDAVVDRTSCSCKAGYGCIITLDKKPIHAPDNNISVFPTALCYDVSLALFNFMHCKS